jgi:hypothetical protein
MSSEKTTIEIVAIWVTVLGAFVGAGWALMQNADKMHGERVKETLGYVDRFNKAPFDAIRQRFDQFWDPRAEEVFAKTRAGEKELYDYLNTTLRANDFQKDITTMAGIFENLRACACADLCDAKTVQHFFAKEAFDFYGMVAPYIFEQRKRLKDPSFGAGLEVIARSSREKDVKGLRRTYCDNKGALTTPPAPN